MKSCRTPSMLTVYSSVSPGRINRTVWPSMETAPLRGSATAPWTAAVLCRFGSASKAPEDWRSPKRPTSAAVTQKRSFTALVTVEISHKPSRVASPSSRWKTQRNRAPSPLGMIASPSPW